VTQVNHAALKRCSCPEHEGPNPLPVSMFSPSSKRGKAGVQPRCKVCRATAARLSRRADGTEKFRPCLVCGAPTSSALGVCRRTPACTAECSRLMRQQYPERRNEYVRRYRAKLAKPERPQGLKKPEPVIRPAHPCASCGRPTRSASPVCSRSPCVNEYRRLERVGQQRFRASFVYGVWFPAAHVLKVGFTSHVTDSPFVCSARTRAERRKWETAGSGRIWKQPGDLRTEAWMQATLAFRWEPPFEQKQGRLCEWFAVPGLTGREVAAVLDEMYQLVPVPLARSTPDARAA
jgi:hypothetical protein